MTTKPKAIELAEEMRAELLVDQHSPYKTTNVSKKLIDEAATELRRLSALEQQGEPFGYFCAYAFGWTDCAATDEGAIALYEHPAADLTDELVSELRTIANLATGEGDVCEVIAKRCRAIIAKVKGVGA